MNRYGKRCVLYPRVSTEMQVDGYSLEGQKTMLTRFADREEMVPYPSPPLRLLSSKRTIYHGR